MTTLAKAPAENNNPPIPAANAGSLRRAACRQAMLVIAIFFGYSGLWWRRVLEERERSCADHPAAGSRFAGRKTGPSRNASPLVRRPKPAAGFRRRTHRSTDRRSRGGGTGPGNDRAIRGPVAQRIGGDQEESRENGAWKQNETRPAVLRKTGRWPAVTASGGKSAQVPVTPFAMRSRGFLRSLS